MRHLPLLLLTLAGCTGALGGDRSATWPLRADSALANAGDRDLVHVDLDLRLGTESSEPPLRERAARHLAVEDPRARRALLRVASTDPAARVRGGAAQTLIDLLAGGRALSGAEVALLQRRLGLERSPRTRGFLEELLEGPR